MTRIVCIQHVSYEGPGSITTWCNDHSIELVPVDGKSVNLATLNDEKPFDAVIVMGGPMAVYETDSNPWLIQELGFIKKQIERNVPVLGICLGAQIVAAAMGARVYPGQAKEIGWRPVKWTDSAQAMDLFNYEYSTTSVLHWHGDTFDLPEGAVLLARNDLYENQAFLLGNNVLGLQFHLEFKAESLEKMLENSEEELMEGGEHVQTPEKIREGAKFLETNNRMMNQLLDNWLKPQLY